MTRRPRRPRTRASDIARGQRSSLTQLAFAVVALVMLLVAWNHLAGGAAGCFMTLAGPAGGGAAGEDAAGDDARHDAGGDAGRAAGGDAGPVPAPGGVRVEGVRRLNPGDSRP